MPYTQDGTYPDTYNREISGTVACTHEGTGQDSYRHKIICLSCADANSDEETLPDAYSHEANDPDSYYHEVSGTDPCRHEVSNLDAYTQEGTDLDTY